jgi:hypothetical protein
LDLSWGSFGFEFGARKVLSSGDRLGVARVGTVGYKYCERDGVGLLGLVGFRVEEYSHEVVDEAVSSSRDSGRNTDG